MSKRSLAIAAAGVGGSATDPNFKNVSLLLQGDVSNPDLTYNAFSDASSNNFPIAPNGDTYGSSFSPYNTSWSNYFDGSGDSLDVANNEALNMSSDNFTIEFWVNMSTLPGTYARILQICHTNVSATTDEGIWFEISPSNQLGFSCRVGSTDSGVTDPNALVTNTWIHFAAVRNGSTLTFYKNGVSLGTSSISGAVNFSSSFVLALSRWRPGTRHINGYLSNVRVVKGTAVYTSNFTPSTTPLTAISATSLLTCQSNRIIDNSSNNFAITRNGDVAVRTFSPFTDTDTTTGSGYFDGSGDYLSAADNVAFEVGSGNFTLECWFYWTGTGAPFILSKSASSSYSPYVIGVMGSTGNLGFIASTGGSSWDITITPAGTLEKNAWVHAAAVRNGSTFTLYKNGVSIGTATSSATLWDNTNSFGVCWEGSSATFSGYVSNARLVKGTALYTGNFTPPTSPLTAVSGTSLLTLQTRGAVQNIGFIDSSPNKFPITKYGNTTQGTFSPYGNLWSNYFDGSGDYLSIGSQAALGFGTGNWTIETWVYAPSTSSGTSQRIWSFGDDRDGLEIVSGNFQSFNGAAKTIGTANANTWVHVAGVRDSGTIYWYINGILATSYVDSTNSSSRTLDIGTVGTFYSPKIQFYTGYISNLRIVKGTAVYTSNFTPSTTPLTAVSGTSLLTCQSNRFIDNSSNNFTLTVNGNTSVQRFSPFNPAAPYSAATIGGSGYFDGSGDYLTGPTGSINLDLSSGAWTIECWVYMNTTSTGQGGLISVMSSGLVGWVIDIGVDVSGAVSFFNYNGADPIAPSIGYPQGYPYTINPYCWNHIAVSSNGSTVKLFINGVLQAATGSGTPNFNSSCQLSIGQWAYGSGARRLNGYLNDVRIVKGTQVYTSTFTPPTSPLTAISGTQYLGNMTNAGIPDAAMMNDLETVGNAQVSTSVKKYGTGSLAFDGSGDYLVVPNSPNLILANGNFTIELWVYFAIVNGNYRRILGWQNGSASNSNYSYVIQLSDWNKITATLASGSTNYIVTSSTTPTVNTWYHVAFVRSGNTNTLYINGTSEGTPTTLTSFNAIANGKLIIGADLDGSFPMNGYIDDLRITKGLARYTANFTPPTQSLPNR